MNHFILNEEQAIKMPRDEIYLDGLLYIQNNASGLALTQLKCIKKIACSHNATSLFEKPGALKEVARRALTIQAKYKFIVRE